MTIGLHQNVFSTQEETMHFTICKQFSVDLKRILEIETRGPTVRFLATHDPWQWWLREERVDLTVFCGIGEMIAEEKRSSLLCRAWQWWLGRGCLTTGGIARSKFLDISRDIEYRKLINNHM
jgi:hypothetical protein